MRLFITILVKLLLSLVIVYFTLGYYNIYSFNNGLFSTFEDELNYQDLAFLVNTDKIEYLEKWGDNEENYVFFISEDDGVKCGVASDSLVAFLDNSDDVKEISHAWGIVGAVGLLVVICIPVGRKK